MLARITLTAAFVFFILRPLGAVENPRPRLVMFLTIDQARGDYLERFRPALGGGLGKLLDEGFVFEDAHHFHAGTVTGPGHVALATGLFPSHSGIVGNNWFDRTENQDLYCVEDRGSPVLRPSAGAVRSWTGTGRSPKNLLGTALGDWMRSALPGARVFSLGGKDRAAIPMGGRGPDGAYWYDPRSGQWVTSRYYASEYPAWVEALHRRRPADAYAGTKWEPLPVDEKLLESMEVVAWGAGADDAGTPKSVGRSIFPDAGLYTAIFESPYIDQYLLELARLAVREERLGADETPDFLALSFSSVDAIGHAYGPNSRETLDAVLRLDRELARFFDFLDGTVGAGNVAVALSSDHGVAPLPEVRLAQGLDAGRLSSRDFECFQRSGRAFEQEFGKDDWFVAPLIFDEEVLARRRLTRETAEAFLAKELMECPSVARVWTRSELEGSRESSDDGVDPMLELHRNSYHRGRSPDLVLQLEKWVIDRRHGTTHGSAYEYDTHVPAVVLWPGAKPGRSRERIATVDLPVTLAALLRIATPPGLDGVDRSPLFR